MSDPVFEAFRRKLADVVTVAINSGKRVAHDSGDCCCPLGSHPGSLASFPFCGEAARLFGIESDAAFSFIRGFGGCTGYPEYDRGPYFKLGRLYRARFP